MLRFLRISRLAVIDAVEVEFDPGFNVLTGETGAGKSILVEAVGLLLGGRASGDLVRTGEDTATVEAIFQRGDHEIVVRREITAQGRSRAFIDGSLVTASALRDMASDLIELHGQHEHQTLLDPATHLTAVDAFGQLDGDRVTVAEAYAAWRAALNAVTELRGAARDRATRLEFAAFQLAEIDRIAPKAGEDEELAATRAILANASRIERLCTESYAALYESDGAALGVLSGVWKRLADLSTLDPAFEPYLGARDGIKAQLEDLAMFLRRYVDTLDVSSARLQQIEDRLAGLERLKRKHGPSLADVMARQDALRQEVSDLDSSEERLAASERELLQRRAAFETAATALSHKRRAAARAFAPALVELLAGLALERARFEVTFSDTPVPEAEWTALGTDRVEFHVSMNPGEDLRPLARVVSGGELSRVMLALKTMTFGARQATALDAPRGRVPGLAAPGMIFDEVDTGIGGRVAEVVGRRLRALGSTFQVLCITHLPQVAACADTHFVIQKSVQGDRTLTSVRRLSIDQRVEELARMLSGSTVSDAARASAREMLTAGFVDEAKGESKPKGESETAKAKGRRAGRGA